MYLSQLTLSDFRNYRQLELSLGPGLFLFHGDNAQGKTNLLEAVAMLATGNSFHAAGDREVVSWQNPEHIARLEGWVRRQEGETHIEIMIFDPTPAEGHTRPTVRGIEMPANTPRKRIKINDLARKTMELIGQMRVVLFAPTDLHLIDGPPDERRRFLDRALCQIRPHYCQDLVRYRKVIVQRSALLKRIRDKLEEPGMLTYLDEQLALYAHRITHERIGMVAALNQHANGLQERISGGLEHLEIVYRPSFKLTASATQQDYLEQLRTARRKEILQGVCLLGPHRDDLEFIVNNINMLTYGSRGQQRTAALSSKLAELTYMQDSTGEEPVLLLDDVFSELDHSRREYLLQLVLQHEQVLLTATDLTGFPAEIVERAHIYRVTHGAVEIQQ